MVSEIKSMSTSEWGMLIFLSNLWGGSFFFVGVAVKALPPLTIVSLRVSLASLTLYLRLRSHTPLLAFMAAGSGKLGIKTIVTATGQVTFSGLILTPIAVLFEKPFTLSAPGLDVWLSIIGLAVISTALDYVLYFRILATAGATNVLLVTLLVPLSALLFGIVFLGEQIEIRHFIGMGLISIGLLSIDGRVFVLIKEGREKT